MIKSRQLWGGVALKIYDYEGSKNISGNRIRQARVTQRMSQAALAAKLQLNGVIIEREAISKIESGERFVADYELSVFAQVLGVSIYWLIGQAEN